MSEDHNTGAAVTEQVGGIFMVPLFDAAACRRIIDEAEELNRWMPGKIQGSREGEEVSWVLSTGIRDALIMNLAEFPATLKSFDGKIRSVIVPLVNKRWKMELNDHSGAQIIRYTPGGHYKPHIDNEPGIDDRQFSVVCYLNDDFTGGSTDFPTMNYTAVPRAGHALVFPSEYLHSSLPIVAGRKYILVAWLVGPLPVSWI
jgi:prolyl 4-hydroxylase